MTAAALVALAVWLMLPSSAGARVPERFYGVVTQGGHSLLQPADFARMANTGVGSLRFVVYWPAIQTTRGSCTEATRFDPGNGFPFDDNHCSWAQLDPLVAGAAREGIELLPFLYGSPPWVDSNDGLAKLTDRVPPVGTAADRSAWGRFLEALVLRYGPNGVFWDEHPELAGTGKSISLWQIWNEPGSPAYMQPRPSPTAYARLLDVSAAAIRKTDPNASILLAGLFNNPKAHLGGMPIAAFLRRLYYVPGVSDDFDIVALHPYGPGPAEVRRQIVIARRILNANGDRATPIWITELGWASDGVAGDDWVRGFKGQAKSLRQAFRLLRENRIAWRIAGVNWFSWRDVPAVQSSCRSCPFTGLVRVGGTPKPALASFRSFAASR